MKVFSYLKLILLVVFTTSTLYSQIQYETVKGDPLKAQIYTLKNGLKVYMSVYKDAPRIQTFITAKTGSKNDPSDATGLAHYLEHMLFKGSSKIASLDWEKEKVILQQISQLYEQNRNADEKERLRIYAQIDSLSSLAAKYVATNEYDKMISSLGAKRTNAYTWVDQTVYVNDIPSNSLEKWLKLEAERFNELVLRLFHTELEAVYEEFNIGQNSVYRKRSKALDEALYPNHPYGTQTTIGKGEHLKKPSMEKIHAYFNKYYVPNNMAIVLAGDFNPDEVVTLVEKYFGHYKEKAVPEWKIPQLKPIIKPVFKEIFSKETATMTMAWRLDGIKSKDVLVCELLDMILSNGEVGLIDLNLLQNQLVGNGTYSYLRAAYDYSAFTMSGEPKTGQSLEEVEKLLLDQIKIIKEGNFEEWMIEAIINDFEYSEIKQMEYNYGRANKMLSAFLYDIEWTDIVNRYDRMRKITKKDIIDFANKNLNDNQRVVVYKREGKPKDIVTIAKPTITPIDVNRNQTSAFKKEWDLMKQPPLTPSFLDFNNRIETKYLKNGIRLDYIKNPYNNTFSMEYIVNMGGDNDKLLPIAVRYLEFLGTDKYTPEELKKELFKLGLSFSVYAANDVAYVTLSGLESSFENGVELFEHLLMNARADQEALDKMIETIKKERADEKKEKWSILYDAMYNYAQYGQNSPLLDRLSEAELDAIKTNELIHRINTLTSYDHDIFYYGTIEHNNVLNILNQYHIVPQKLLKSPPERVYKPLNMEEDKVVFVSYPDMTQAQVIMISKGRDTFDLEEMVNSRLFNEYFGSGLSSIVFQEIRESRALAYSAYAFNGSPGKKDKPHYFRAFIGTQADKIKEAIPAMVDIVENMPVSKELIQNAAQAIIKKINSERITKSSAYWNYRSVKKKGYSHDLRKDVYDNLKPIVDDQEALVEMLKKFQKEVVKGRKYTYLVLGDKNKIDMEFLKTIGKVEEFSIDEIFGDMKLKKP